MRRFVVFCTTVIFGIGLALATAGTLKGGEAELSGLAWLWHLLPPTSRRKPPLTFPFRPSKLGSAEESLFLTLFFGV